MGIVALAVALFADTSKLAARMPHARLIETETGGHLLLGQTAGVEREIKAFIAEH